MSKLLSVKFNEGVRWDLICVLTLTYRLFRAPLRTPL